MKPASFFARLPVIQNRTATSSLPAQAQTRYSVVELPEWPPWALGTRWAGLCQVIDGWLLRQRQDNKWWLCQEPRNSDRHQVMRCLAPVACRIPLLVLDSKMKLLLRHNISNKIRIPLQFNTYNFDCNNVKTCKVIRHAYLQHIAYLHNAKSLPIHRQQ